MTLLNDYTVAKPKPMRWSAEEFYDLVELGAFRRRRVQVVNGELIEMPPMGAVHAAALRLLTHWAQRAFPQCYLSVQMPFEAPGDYTPEPDLALLTPEIGRAVARPKMALLIVEVSDSSLELDRRMGSVYASAQVPEYWLLNTVDRKLEIYRQPAPDPTASTGWRYQDLQLRNDDETVAPSFDPAARVAISEFLPG